MTVESARSSAAREIYLNDSKHANHKKTEAIISVIGSRKTSININANMEAYKLATALKRKGGRPPTPAMEFVFSLPKREDLRPTKEQWETMIVEVVKSMAVSMEINTEELTGIVRAVAHQQEQDDTKGTGDHCHVVIGKFTNNGKYLRALQKKGVIHASKLAFNKAVRDVMGVDYTTYRAEQNYNSKKRAPIWKVKAARAMEEVEAASKLLNQFHKQSEKWLQAFQGGDSKQLNRQFNRIQKSIDGIEGLELAEEAESSFYDMVMKINEQSESKLKTKKEHPKKENAPLMLFGKPVK
uniref:Uncharacterized protein n=1 Tax=Vibrio tasmaniensis TaxID=212663 RepID=A0A0H3ZLB9_9VIBR|nr:hypothetical protein [Vibrio tasmaniensis]